MPSKELTAPEPKKTWTDWAKPSPLMVIVSPPSLLPNEGVTEKIAGSGSTPGTGAWRISIEIRAALSSSCTSTIAVPVLLPPKRATWAMPPIRVRNPDWRPLSADWRSPRVVRIEAVAPSGGISPLPARRIETVIVVEPPPVSMLAGLALIVMIQAPLGPVGATGCCLGAVGLSVGQPTRASATAATARVRNRVEIVSLLFISGLPESRAQTSR